MAVYRRRAFAQYHRRKRRVVAGVRASLPLSEDLLSRLGFSRPGFTLPVAALSLTQGTKQHLLGLYSGLLVSGPVVSVPTFGRSAASKLYQSGSVASLAYQSGSKASKIYD